MQKKIFSILIILLLTSFIASSCTNNDNIFSKFTSVIIYSSKDGIHDADFSGQNNKLLVSKDSILMFYDNKEAFNKVLSSPIGISTDKRTLFFYVTLNKRPQEAGDIAETTRYCQDLFSVDANGSNLKKLTNEKFECLTNYFSSDRTYVAFIAYVAFIGTSMQKEAIYILRMTDGNLKRVTPWYNDTSNTDGLTFAGITEPLTFSKDCKKIFFVAKNKNGNRYDLNMLDIETGNLKIVVSDAIDIAIHGWSPNGKMLTFAITISGNRWINRKDKLCVINNDGSDFKEVTAELYQIFSVKWSGDSSKILFNYLGEPEMKCPPIPKNQFLSVVDSKGTGFKDYGGYDTIQGYWAVDGNKIVAVIGTFGYQCEGEIGSKEAIYIINSGSMDPLRITQYYDSIDKLIFDPIDSNKIFFTAGIFPYFNTLRILNLNNKSIQTMKSFEDNQDIADIVFSSDYEKYFIHAVRTTFKDDVEGTASLYVYNTDTNALISKFDGVNEYLYNIGWIDKQKIAFMKGVAKFGDIEGNLGSICIFDLLTGKILELTPASIDLIYDWWIADIN